MKTIEEMIAVMTAYKEGKKIECRSIDEEHIWGDVDDPKWDWMEYDYRIKPEKPIYRPYESAEEVLEDMRLHGPMISHKELVIGSVEYDLISSIWKDSIYIDINTEETTFQEAFNEVHWQDGTPFGRRVEE